MSESAIPMLVFLGFLFVSLMLILGFGLTSRVEEREEEEASAASGAGGRPGLRFASNAPGSGGRPTVSERVARLEDFLRREVAAVAAFASAPSLTGLVGDDGADDAAPCNGAGGGADRAQS